LAFFPAQFPPDAIGGEAAVEEGFDAGAEGLAGALAAGFPGGRNGWNKKGKGWPGSRADIASMKTQVGAKRQPRRCCEVYVGIDLHSTSTVLGVMDLNGEWLGDRRFATTGRNLIAHVMDVPARQKHLVIEESPMTHWAVGLLRPYCTSIVACDPKHNRLICANPHKRDELDVRNLCRLCRLGELNEVYHTQEDDRFAFKIAVQSYLDLQVDRVRAKNKIKALYARQGLLFPGESVYSKNGRNECLTQVQVTYRSILRRAYRRFDLLDAETTSALKEIERLGRAYPEIAQFRKIPGVGVLGASVFSAYIMTPHRFATRSSLFRYCRLAVSSRSSDGKPLGYERLERTGSSQLKAMSYRAWLGAVRTRANNEVKGFYQAALEANRGQPKKARLSTQRKILTVMWSMWKHQREYEPAKFMTETNT